MPVATMLPLPTGMHPHLTGPQAELVARASGKTSAYEQDSVLSNIGIWRPAVVAHADRRGRDPVASQLGVWAVEQITQRTPIVRVHPATASMLRTIVEHVAALTERCELMQRAVARIMVEVRTGQDHRCPPSLQQDVLRRPSYAPALAIAPALPAPVPPPPVAKVEDLLPVRTSTMLAVSPCPHEAYLVRELRPVDRVQEHVLGADRHQASPSEASGFAVQRIMEPPSLQSALGRALHDGI